MRLVYMDVDRNGANQRYRIGPLSPGLNAIVGGRGAGKTTLLGWLRTIAEENLGRTYSQPDPAWQNHSYHVAGMAEIHNRGSQYRVTTDRNGKIRFDAVASSPLAEREYHRRWDGRIDERIGGTNLTDSQREAFAGLAAANGTYDTPAALEQLAQRLGIDTESTSVASNSDREPLLARKRELEAQLAHIQSLNVSRETLIARQTQLEAELQTVRTSGEALRYEGQNIEHGRLEQRTVALESDLEETLRQVETLDREIAQKQAELKLLEVDPTTAKVGESYRVQLQKLDDRLNRWRQTLRDLKAHRDTIENDATDARLDKQIGEQLSSTKDADPRAAMRSLEAQIMSTRKQLDMLVDRYTTVPGYDYRTASQAVAGTGYRPNEVPQSHGVYRDASGQTYVGHPTYLPESSILPETLRSMQKDLHEVCQQLARHEAQTASETLRQQVTQLKRCEVELLESVEKLIEERAALLRRIANEHHISIEQLTLAFGQWCQCHDHPHLHDWLLSEEGSLPTETCSAEPAARQRLIEEIEQLKTNHRDASVRADECKRQIRDADIHRRGTYTRKVEVVGRPEVEIQQDLHRVSTDLTAIVERERLHAELNEVNRRLGAVPANNGIVVSRFRQRTDQHIAGLMGDKQWQQIPQASFSATDQKRYDLVDGVVRTTVPTVGRRAVPAEIERTAMRLAVAEGMSQRGEPISIVIDDALESVPAEIQRSAVAYLSSIAANQQQIVLLTQDPVVGELVQSYQGQATTMQPMRVSDSDPNQQLMALANDHEADKWYQPAFPHERRRGARNEFYLTEASLIEDLPAIDPDLAARCRIVGVDRIGDLLDVDPNWLADQIRVAGVSAQTVEAWQAVACLLCNVPNLRPFDARVIVGAGIHTPDQLAHMHPSQLLDRVERFLTTDQGRKILRSGSSYELSRITAWIASAKGNAPGTTSVRGNDYGYEYDDDRNLGDRGRYSRDRGDRTYTRSRRTRDGSRSSSSSSRQRSYPVISRSGSRSQRNWDGRRYERREYEPREPRASRDRESQPREYEPREYEAREYEARNRYERQNTSAKSRKVETREQASTRKVTTKATSNANADSNLKFYLELESPVVDAPSIGPRMASRLEEHGIITVEDLLNADAATLAEQMDHRRVETETIVAWQQQARLVCQIPNLRGHDAQLLVACELTTPSTLATMDAEAVLTQVSEVAESKEGQRILRGSKEPDLEEVTDWIAWAASHRKLRAA